MASPIRFADFDPSKFDIGALVRKNGRTFCPIRYDGKSGLLIQMPHMTSRFGASRYPADGPAHAANWNLDITLDPETPHGTEVRTTMEALEARLLNIVAENSKEWFGRDGLDKDTIIKANMHNSVIRFPRKPEDRDRYPPSLKMKLPSFDGVIQTKFFHMDKSKATVDDVVKNCRVTPIIDVRAWIMNNTFGLTLRVMQLKVEKTSNLSEYAFADDDTPGGGESPHTRRQRSSSHEEAPEYNEYEDY